MSINTLTAPLKAKDDSNNYLLNNICIDNYILNSYGSLCLEITQELGNILSTNSTSITLIVLMQYSKRTHIFIDN